MEAVREIAPIGPVIDYSERVVTIAQNVHRSPEDRGAALQAVFTEMGRGLWTRDVVTAWTYLIANLTQQAQIPGNDAPG